MKHVMYIRTDANETIGTGHVMRCISIANKVRDKGYDVVFIMANESSRVLLADRGFESICLETAWNNLESEIPLMQQLIRDNGIEKLLVDHYYVTERYFRELGELTDIVYIDDLNAFPYPVKMVVNYNIYAEDLRYEQRYRESGLKTKFLLGPGYAPLRSEFELSAERSYASVNKILITSGGSDNYNMIGNILAIMLDDDRLKSRQFYCVIGRFNINKERLFERYSGVDNVHLLYDISNMSDHMRACDVCVTAGGSTIYELCACGTPSVVYTLADNQLMIADKVSRMGLMPYVGDIRDDMSGCLQRILKEIDGLENEARWKLTSDEMRKLVDGRGAERVANELMNDMEEKGAN